MARYNRVCGMVTQLVARIKKRRPDDPFRSKMTEDLLAKLYNMGVIATKSSLAKAEAITVSAFCRYNCFDPEFLSLTLNLCACFQSPITCGDGQT